MCSNFRSWLFGKKYVPSLLLRLEGSLEYSYVARMNNCSISDVVNSSSLVHLTNTYPILTSKYVQYYYDSLK